MAHYYSRTTWVDGDANGAGGTQFTAARFNNIEAGLEQAWDNMLTESGGETALVSRIYGTPNRESYVSAHTDSGASVSQVSASKDGTAAGFTADGDNARARAFAGGVDRLVTDSAGNSDFALTATPWLNVTFATGWRTLSPYTVQARKEGKRIFLRGIVERITSTFSFPAAVLTLPASLRPINGKQTFVWIAARGTSSTQNYMYRAYINSTADGNPGQLWIDQALTNVGSNGAVGSWLYLDGVSAVYED